MKNRILITGIVFVLLIVSLLLALRSHVEIINGSGQKIAGIRLWASDKLIWEGSLEPDQAKVIYFTVERDGIFQISGLIQKTMFTSEELGYITQYDRQNHKLIINQHGHVKYYLLPE